MLSLNFSTNLENYENIFLKDIINGLKNDISKVLDKDRVEHSIGVLETAFELAQKNGFNSENELKKIAIASLLHDIAKNLLYDELKEIAYLMEKDKFLNFRYDYWSFEKILHAPVSAYITSKSFGIIDISILSSIFYHTTGKENMTIIEKIIFVADMVEKKRDFPEVEELRRIAFKDLNSGVLKCLKHTINYLTQNGIIIHEESLKAYNSLKTIAIVTEY